ncbi:hypothetical protein [Streptomyces sp. NPDC001410]|uniref:hypothetical protein n=1 Tax=Streptomyces sp. NPDC001410 TaxID=3364574 RepID=UPI00367F5444
MIAAWKAAQPSVSGHQGRYEMREIVGGDMFFAILKGWPKEPAYGKASVANFEEYAEKVSGKSLSALFGAWLFEPTVPAGGCG